MNQAARSLCFEHCVQTSTDFLSLLQKEFFANGWVRDVHGITNVPTGVEHIFNDAARALLAQQNSPTALFLRHLPDNILVQKNSVNPLTFVEYKTHCTPLFMYQEQQWDRTDIKASSFTTYQKYAEMGVRLLMLFYVPYHARPVLMEFVQNIRTFEKPPSAYQGYGEKRLSVDLTSLRPAHEVLQTEFGVPPTLSIELLRRVLLQALQTPSLQTQHHQNSPYRDRKTGWNWTAPYQLDPTYFAQPTAK